MAAVYNRIVLVALVLLVAGFLSQWHLSPAYAEEIDLRTDRLLALSGHTKQLEMLGPALLSAIPWDAFPDQKARNQAEVTVRQSAGKDRLLPLLRQALKADYREAYVEALLQFYDSKLGRKVSRLTGNSLDQETLRNIWEGRAIVAAMNDTRRDLLERLARLEVTGKANAQLSRAVVRGLVKGFLDHSLEGGNLIESIGRKLETVETTIATGDRRTGDIALAAFAHTLQSLNEAELKDLLAFQQSEHAAWFREVVQRGLEAAAFMAAATLGEALTRGGPTAKAKKEGPRRTPAAEGDPGPKDLVIGVPKP